MKWIEPTPPMPSQFENERTIDEMVGNQMKKLTIATGMPIISPSTTLSDRDSRTARLRRSRAVQRPLRVLLRLPSPLPAY